MAERTAREEWMLQVLLDARPYIQQASQDVGHGFYRPENPHDFTPDSENTPEEIEAHKAACEAYDKGEYEPGVQSGWLTPNLHVTVAPWGTGTYVIRDPKAEEILQAINKLQKEFHG